MRMRQSLAEIEDTFLEHINEERDRAGCQPARADERPRPHHA